MNTIKYNFSFVRLPVGFVDIFTKEAEQRLPLLFRTVLASQNGNVTASFLKFGAISGTPFNYFVFFYETYINTVFILGLKSPELGLNSCVCVYFMSGSLTDQLYRYRYTVIVNRYQLLRSDLIKPPNK
jgi:hypothetical protein